MLLHQIGMAKLSQMTGYGSLALGGSPGRQFAAGPSASVTMLSFHRSLQIVALE